MDSCGLADTHTEYTLVKRKRKIRGEKMRKREKIPGETKICHRQSIRTENSLTQILKAY